MNHSTPSNDLAVLADPALAELVEGLTARLKAGEAVDLDDWLTARPDYAEELRRLFPMLRLLADLSRSGDLSVPPLGAEEIATGTLGDYRLIREVGRGGMGVVYEAEQVSLGRRVALKVLPLAATLDPRQLQRFHNEARAAAGLHHTNIVPIHAVGCERGVHYYAMQFIDGHTLADFIAQQQSASPSQELTTDAAQRKPAAGSAPTVSPAAQATSAAPRDRAYFRRVAEWGIQAAEALDCAHALGVIHRDVKPANLLLDEAGRLWITDFGLAQVQSDARLTLTGDLVGTLRYMSPEQALAKRVVVDHRTDVYSLGATLYELLTLQPVFSGTDRQELLRQIAFEEPKAPRRLNRAIPSELETIVLKALEKEPADRFATAQDLADDLGRFLRDESILARRPSLARRAQKWARRHRAVVWVGAVVAVLVSGAGLWYQQDRAERRAEATRREADERRGAENALAEARRLARQSRWPQARAVLAQALAQLGQAAPAESRRSLERAQHDLGLSARLDGIRLKKVVIIENRLYWVKADGDYAATFREAGLLDDQAEPATVAARVVGSAIRPALVAALDDWAGTTKDRRRRAWLLEVARRADPNPLRDAVRNPALWDDAKALARLARDVDVAAVGPQLLTALGDRLRETGGDAVPLLRAAQAQYPSDFWLNYDLANRLPKPEEAIGYYRAAIALRPDAPAVYTGLGRALYNRGQLTEAVAACRQAVRLEPKYALAHNNLGVFLLESGRRDEAIAEFRKAIDRDPQDPRARSNLGEALRRTGRLKEAAAQIRLAIRLNPRFAPAHNNLGHVLDAQGKPDEAFAEFQQAVRIDPNLAPAHNNLANAWKHKGRLDQAMVEYRWAIQMDPNFAQAYSGLGTALYLKGRREAAIVQFEKALQLDAKCFEAHSNLGVALAACGKLAEAEAEYRKAIELQPSSAEAYYKLGHALRAQGKRAEAFTVWQKAVKLKPDFALAHWDLGLNLRNQGRFAESLASLKRAQELGSRQRNWPPSRAAEVRRAERFAELDAKLPRILRGDAQPRDARDQMALAQICQLPSRSLYAAAVRFYVGAFAEHPPLVDDLSGRTRYNAACAAALAGCGHGKDADQTDDPERARFRRQALNWLRADLAAWGLLLDKEPDRDHPVLVKTMRYWQQDTDLVGVRGEALVRLPPKEREGWLQLWAQVEQLLARTKTKVLKQKK